MKLFIVESPKKCKTIRKYLGSDYRLEASIGHIKALPKKGLNVDVKNGFEPTYEVTSDKKKVVSKLKELAKEADEIILATDPDREGEAIAHHIYTCFDKASQAKCVRVTYQEITEKKILEALKNPREINQNQVNAQKARQVLDRLIGYKVSPVLWYTVGSGTSAGRVQSIALKFVCSREKEIEAFKPEDFWHVDALLQANEGNFWARVVTKDKQNRYLDDNLAKADLEALQKARFKVSKVDRKEKKSSAKPPFITSSLQSTCASLFGWGTKKVSTLAQALYEQGKITYIRSDSFNISDEALDAVRGLIKKAASPEYLPKSPLKYSKKSKVAAQEAHECIRPTDVYDKGDDIEDVGAQKLYKLVRDRFIACQMNPMVVDTVTYHIKTDSKHDLIAKGQTIKFDGWRKVYSYSKAKEEILPAVEEKEELQLEDTKKSKHTTKPPPRYSEGGLVEKMEAEGVGRPSTYSSIINSIISKGYISVIPKSKGALKAEHLGMKVFDYLDPNFQDFFMDVGFTALLEDDLDLIEDGKKKFLEVVQPVYDKMMAEIKEAQAKSKDAKKPAESTGHKCTVCDEGEIVKKDGRFGEFYACDQYPKCKTVYEISDDDGNFHVKTKSKPKSTGKKCPKCQEGGRDGEMLERKSRKGDTFLGCSNYPKCKHTESVETANG